jgi:hypothetical protein
MTHSNVQQQKSEITVPTLLNSAMSATQMHVLKDLTWYLSI